MRDALEGLIVLDFTQIAAGPTATMLLADIGAKVIKFEPPEGELGRTLGSDRAGVDGILQADSGLMSPIGTPGAEPSKVRHLL